MTSLIRRRFIIIIACFCTLFATAWLEFFLQRNHQLIGAGINRTFLFLLINAHILVLGFLLYIIIRQSIRLFLERKKGVPGAVFKSNLLFAFIFFSVIPSFFIFFTAGRLITRNIDNWFQARIETGLKNSLHLHEEHTKQDRLWIQKTGCQLACKKSLDPAQINDLALHNTVIYTSIDSVKDEIKTWRHFRKFNDRTTQSLLTSFFKQLNNIKNEELFDFYGSLYWVKKCKNSWLILAKRYPPEIRYPLIELQNSIADYEQLKSMRNPLYASYFLTFVLVTILILFLAIWCAFYLARGITKPIQELLDATAQIRKGRWDVQLPCQTSDDLRTLVEAFNEMMHTIQQAKIQLEEKHAEVVKANKLRTWQEAAQQMAHEIKNPLTPIQLATQRLQRRLGKTLCNDEVFFQCTDTILEQVALIKNLVTHFSEFATMPILQCEMTNLNQIIQEVVCMYRLSSDISITIKLNENIPHINVDIKKIKRVLVNLFDNSIRAIKSSGEIIITTQQSNDGQWVELLFSDTGPGIAPEVCDKLFLPYVSTEKKNMGLGLAIVHDIITQHGGTISLIPSEKGVTFLIQLPI